MYRIAKLAEILNVATVQIHEKLILYKEELSEHTYKEKGVTHISDQGLLILKHAFEEERIAASRLTYTARERDSDADSKREQEGSLSEMDRRELELLNLKDRINQSRSELHRLNLESRKLDEAIAHYMGILKEDMDKRIREEDQLEGRLRLRKQTESAGSQIEFFSGSGRK